ncbi:MAG: Eco57I restriction-modification methylase domain-containing protein, partial [Treponema sp.]|nr:Eco57I restriction-modification methylase domain-containing protein [Treponema sp.]
AFDHLVNDLKNKSDSFIKNVTSQNFWKKGNGKMEFDAIVGNPPYQEMDGGAQASANPIYNKFVVCAEKTKPNFVSMIMPSRWYAGGKGLDEFRDKMLNDIHLQVLHDFLTPDELFPNTNIRGGLCYFLWNKNYDNSKDFTHVITHSGKKIISDSMRTMKIEGAEIFIRNIEAVSIIKKVSKITPENFENHVSSRKPFGLDTTFTKSSDFKTTNKGLKEPIECYGKGWKIGYLEKSLIKQNSAWIDVWKVFTARANNIGTELNDDNLVTKLGKPKLICTESYLLLGVGLKLNESSAKKVCKYFTTKFARFMHSLAKASQDATAKTYKFVPLQDFSSASDIDWSKSIPEIDKQLYKKYKLSKDEVNFIEKMIKPMD